MTEAMQPRSAAAGVRKARVGTADFNTSAISAYAKAFDRAGSASAWSLSARISACQTPATTGRGEWRDACIGIAPSTGYPRVHGRRFHPCRLRRPGGQPRHRGDQALARVRASPAPAPCSPRRCIRPWIPSTRCSCCWGCGGSARPADAAHPFGHGMEIYFLVLRGGAVDLHGRRRGVHRLRRSTRSCAPRPSTIRG